MTIYLEPRVWSLAYTVDVLVANEKAGGKKTVVGTIYAKMFDFHSNMTLYNMKGEMVSSSKKWIITTIGACVAERVSYFFCLLVQSVCLSVISVVTQVLAHTLVRIYFWCVCADETFIYDCQGNEVMHFTENSQRSEHNNVER